MLSQLFNRSTAIFRNAFGYRPTVRFFATCSPFHCIVCQLRVSQLKGSVQYLNVFNTNFKDAVPVCIDMGVQIHVRSKESIQVLQATAFRDLPKPIQAADALRAEIEPRVSPSDERNVGGIIGVEPLDTPSAGESPVLICVGKKP
jgi:hypothetical protein